jgi:catechol 2,3-dioxygenase-like lactoylglutathione lyase family enzyme
MSSADSPPLDSIVFRTRNLAGVRAWYSGTLGLKVAVLRKNNREFPDEDARYVNFDAGNGVLLCFETGLEVDRARIVLRVPDLPAAIAARGLQPAQSGDNWAIVRDPEGREVILQAP